MQQGESSREAARLLGCDEEQHTFRRAQQDDNLLTLIFENTPWTQHSVGGLLGQDRNCRHKAHSVLEVPKFFASWSLCGFGGVAGAVT